MVEKSIYIRNEFNDEIHVTEQKDFSRSRLTGDMTVKIIRSYSVYEPIKVFGGTLNSIKKKISNHRGVAKCTWKEFKE